MKIKNDTGIAVNILVALGAAKDDCTRVELVRKTRITPNRLYTVLAELQEKRLVEVQHSAEEPARCVYALGRSADRITLDDIFQLYEGELLNSVCLYCKTGCRSNADAKRCPFGAEMDAFAKEVKARMQGVTIQALINAGDGTP